MTAAPTLAAPGVHALLGVITFAAPALLAAAGLIMLPIIAHMVARAAGKKLAFPSLMLLGETAADAAKRGRPRRWWLLLLRCLAVLLIVLGFARPQWWSAGSPDQPMPITALVLDASVSTTRTLDGVSAFDSIKAAARQQLADTAEPGPIDVILAGAEPVAALPRPTANRAVARNAIARATPTAARADFAAAISLARQRAAARDLPARVILLTDAQATNLPAPGSATAPGSAPAPGSVPGNSSGNTLDARVVAVGTDDPGNVALSAPAVSPARPRAGQAATLRVTATNHRDTPTRITVTAEIQGNDFNRQTSASLEPRATATLELPAPAEWEPGRYAVTFRLAEHTDALPADDAAHLTATVAPRQRVLLITPDAPDRPTTAAYFLKRALTPLADQQNPIDLDMATPERVDAERLRLADTVVLHRPDTLDADAIPALMGYAQRGAGLVLLLGEAGLGDAWAGYDSLLPLRPGEWIDTPSEPTRWAAAMDTNAQAGGVWSELLDPRQPRFRAALDRLRLPGYRRATPREGASVVLQTAGGEPVLARWGDARGRVVVLSAPLEPSRSDLMRSAVWVALLHTMLADALPATPEPPDARPGEPALKVLADAPLDFDNAARPRVVSPTGEPIHDAQLTRTAAGWQWLVPRPDETGHYRLIAGGTTIDTLAVNLDPRESDLRPASNAQLAALTPPQTASDSATLATSGALPGRDVVDAWGWLILLGLAALAVEMFLLAAWER